MPIVLKSGSLNLLEPSGPVQACNGDCFTFTLSDGYLKLFNDVCYFFTRNSYVTFQFCALLAPRRKPENKRSHVRPGAVRHWLLLPSSGITARLLSRTVQRLSLSKSESLGHNFHCMYDRYKDYPSDTKRITTANSCTNTQSRDYAGESDHNKTHTL